MALAQPQALGVERVDLGDAPMVGVVAAGRLRSCAGLSISFLAAEIAAATLRGDEPLGVEVELLHDALDRALGVAGVVDGEAPLVAQHLGVGAQHPQAGRVEGRDPHLARVGTHEVDDASAHLVGGLVGEGDRHDLPGPRVARREEVRDAPGEDPGLARTGAGDDEQGPAAVHDGMRAGARSVLRAVTTGRVAGLGPTGSPHSDSSENEVPAHSHSMVPGGLLVTSSATRFTPSTSRMSRLAIDSITS